MSNNSKATKRMQLVQKAVAGDKQAQLDLARMYRDGDGVRKNGEQAIKWYLLAADQGDTEAMFELGWLYHEDGKNNREFKKQAVFWMTKAAEEGLGKAQYCLGWWYYHGSVGRVRYKEAARWYHKAAEQKEAYAYDELGLLYYYGLGVKRDLKAAVQWYRKGAQAEHEWAMHRYAAFLAHGIGVQKNMELAIQLTKEAAEQGDADAQCSYGDYLAFSSFGPHDYKGAIPWYRKSAEGTSEHANCKLGKIYMGGLGVRKNTKKGYELIRRAAKIGCGEACFEMYKFYLEDNSLVRPDLKRALHWLKRSAKTKEGTYAKLELARRYREGDGVRKNAKLARKWSLEVKDIDAFCDIFVDSEYQLLSEAKAGDADAMSSLGRYYRERVDENKSYGALARKWALRTAQKGNIVGMNDTADYYYHGSYGARRSYEKGFLWYSKAAELGSAYAMNFLSVCFQEGKGTERNAKKAFEWVKKSAAMGDAEGQNMLGVLLLVGCGTRKNARKAVEMFMMSAEQGDPWGVRNCADCMLLGIGFSGKYKRALHYYSRLAQQGSLYAKYRIAEMLIKGQGTKRNRHAGFNMLCKVARAGSADAQYGLYEIYRDGRIIVRKNMERAVEWLTRAAEQGYDAACEELARCYREGIGVDKDARLAHKWERIAAKISSQK